MAALNLYYRDMLMAGRAGKAAFFLGDTPAAFFLIATSLGGLAIEK